MTKPETSTADDDAILARAQEITAERAERARADVRELFGPVCEFQDSAEFKAVRAQANELKDRFATRPQVYNALNAIVQQLDTLAVFVPADARSVPAA